MHNKNLNILIGIGMAAAALFLTSTTRETPGTIKALGILRYKAGTVPTAVVQTSEGEKSLSMLGQTTFGVGNAVCVRMRKFGGISEIPEAIHLAPTTGCER